MAEEKNEEQVQADKIAKEKEFLDFFDDNSSEDVNTETAPSSSSEETGREQEVSQEAQPELEEKPEAEEQEPEEKVDSEEQTKSEDETGTKTDPERLKAAQKEEYEKLSRLREEKAALRREVEILRESQNQPKPEPEKKKEEPKKPKISKVSNNDEFLDKGMEYYNQLVDYNAQLEKEIDDLKNQSVSSQPDPIKQQEQVVRQVVDDYDDVVYNSGFDNLVAKGIQENNEQALRIKNQIANSKTPVKDYYKIAKRYTDNLRKDQEAAQEKAILDKYGITKEQLDAIKAKGKENQPSGKKPVEKSPTPSLGDVNGEGSPGGKNAPKVDGFDSTFN